MSWPTRRASRSTISAMSGQAGDIVIWDNRATMHRVMIDYPVGEPRIMQRVLIEGDKPF